MLIKDSQLSMIMDVKFNRPITQEDTIVPGGYEMKMGNEVIEFDFTNVGYDIDAKDATIAHIEATNADFDSFPEFAEIDADLLGRVVKIPEFFVFTGEQCETDLKPVKLLACSFSTIEGMTAIPTAVCKATELTSNL